MARIMTCGNCRFMIDVSSKSKPNYFVCSAEIPGRIRKVTVLKKCDVAKFRKV